MSPAAHQCRLLCSRDACILSQNAVLHYERALALNPAHVAAQRGLCVPAQLCCCLTCTDSFNSAEATTLAEQLHIDSERETAEATRGDRPPLPQHSLSDEDAAEQLLAAEAMLRLHPAMEGAKCAHVEAMILCRQYDAALKACSLLLPTSLNTVYLKAEAQWRGGRPGDALQTLRAAGIAEGAAGKCAQLASFLKQLMVRASTGLISAQTIISFRTHFRRPLRLATQLRTRKVELRHLAGCSLWNA